MGTDAIAAACKRLTKPQLALYREIIDAGTLYITRYSRWWRTVEVLERRGLIVNSDGDYRQPGFSARRCKECGELWPCEALCTDKPERCPDPDCDGDKDHDGPHFAWTPE